jgi:hypothetical protein
MWFVLRVKSDIKNNMINELSNINGVVVEDVKDDEIVIELTTTDLSFVVKKLKELSKKDGVRMVCPIFSRDNL